MIREEKDPRAVNEIIHGAIRLIESFGWEHDGWSNFGASPRCIRKALWDSAADLYPEVVSKHQQVWPLNDALQRISGAIYKPGTIGGITDWEYRKSTDKDAVVAMLHKAIAMGPVTPTPPMPEPV